MPFHGKIIVVLATTKNLDNAFEMTWTRLFGWETKEGLISLSAFIHNIPSRNGICSVLENGVVGESFYCRSFILIVINN